MKCLVLLSILMIVDVCSFEECVNADNSVSAFLTFDTENICPSQPITARCVINSTQTQTQVVLIWECDGQDGAMQDRVVLCNSASNPVLPLNCKDGDVQLTLFSCKCNDSTIISDAMFMATAGSGRLTCTDAGNQFPSHVSLGIKDPLTPVLEYQIKGVEKNSFANVTIVWSSSGNEQYQYLVSISSLKSDRVNFTTSVAMINVTLEIGVGYSITVTAERCNGSVRSMTSESLDIVLPVPDVVEECGAVPVYNEVILERININWKALTDNNTTTIGVTVDLTGYKLFLILNQFVSTDVSLLLSDIECTNVCGYLQSTLPDTPFHVSVAGENRFGIGPTTSCIDDKISLSNTFLNVTKFNQSAIVIVLEVVLMEINVLCGKDPANLKQCAKAEGILEKTIYLNTLENYINEFKPDVIYYYKVQTERVVVVGSITSSGDMMSSADSSLTAGAVVGVVLAIIIILIIASSLTILLVIIALYNRGVCSLNRQQQEELIKLEEPEGAGYTGTLVPPPADCNSTNIPEHCYNCVKKDLSNTPKGKLIIGLCVTEQRIYCSDSKNIGDSLEYSVRVFTTRNVECREEFKIIGFEKSRGIATDDNNCIYVVDSGRKRVVKFDKEGKFHLCTAMHMDDTIFNKPYGILLTQEYIFVCDQAQNRICIFNRELNLISFIENEEQSPEKYLSQPTDIAFDGTSNCYFVTNIDAIAVFDIDFANNSFRVKRITEMSTSEYYKSNRKFENLRGICIHNDYLYVVHRYIRILCLKYQKNPMKFALVGEIVNISPMVIAQCKGDIYYSRKIDGESYEFVKITHDDFVTLK